MWFWHSNHLADFFLTWLGILSLSLYKHYRSQGKRVFNRRKHIYMFILCGSYNVLPISIIYAICWYAAAAEGFKLAGEDTSLTGKSMCVAQKWRLSHTAPCRLQSKLLTEMRKFLLLLISKIINWTDLKHVESRALSFQAYQNLDSKIILLACLYVLNRINWPYSSLYVQRLWRGSCAWDENLCWLWWFAKFGVWHTALTSPTYHRVCEKVSHYFNRHHTDLCEHVLKI